MNMENQPEARSIGQYETPILIDYGILRKLTESGASGQPEGGSRLHTKRR